MMQVRRAQPTRLKFGTLVFGYLCAAAVWVYAMDAHAEDYTVLTPPPPQAQASVSSGAPPAQPGVRAPTPVPPPFLPPGVKPPEQLQVEAALGARDLSRDFQRYSLMFPPGPGPRVGFAEYLYRGYEDRRLSGIMLAGVTAPILAGLTLMGTMFLYRHGKRDGGGFCTWDEEDSYYDEYSYYNETNRGCEGDDGEIIGIIIISTFGSMAVIATLIPGIVKVAKYNKRMRRLSPLVPKAATGPQFSWGVGPGSLSAKLVF